MNRALDPDAAKRIQTMLNHLNGKHADTILFVARHAAGVPDAIGAELVAVDPDGVDLAVRNARASSIARLEFDAAISGVPDFQLQLRGLLATARSAAPDEPLTSLEEQIASPEGKSSKRHAAK
jgi:putative heme iron utilization protein